MATVRAQLTRLEGELGQGPWFAGEKFSLVDAIFAPAFRYCELFEQLAGLDITAGLPKVKAWANALLARPSTKTPLRPISPLASRHSCRALAGFSQKRRKPLE